MSNAIKVNVEFKTGGSKKELDVISNSLDKVIDRSTKAVGVSDGYGKKLKELSIDHKKAAGEINQSSTAVNKNKDAVESNTRAFSKDNSVKKEQLDLINKLDLEIDKINADFKQQITNVDLTADQYLELSTKVSLA